MRECMRLALFVMLVAALVVAACGPAPTPEVVDPVEAEPAEPTEVAEPEEPVEPTEEPEPVDTPVPEGPRSGGRVVVAHRQEPDRFWAPFSGLTVAHEVGRIMNHTLIGTNADLEYFPILVEEVPTVENGGISEDSLVWTLRIREDVRWHDGEPFRPEDVCFTYETIMLEGTDVRSRVGWNRIEQCTVQEPNTVVFEFSEVDAPFLFRLTTVEILPEHILGGLTAEEVNGHEWMRAPVGTGPFMFKEWAGGDHITVVRNPHYFVEGQPYLDEIIYRIVPDANTLLNMTETGAVDVQFRVQDDLALLIDDMADVERITIQSLTPWLVWMNNNHPLFQDVRTRQALAYGFDKQVICDRIFRGLSEPADGPVSPLIQWAHNPDIAVFRHDPERAKALLEEAGWVDEGGDGIRVARGVQGVEDGTRFSFETANIAGEQVRIDLLSLIHAQWREVGVEAEINLVDVGTLFGDMLPNNRFETAYSYIGRYADPDFGGLFLDREEFGNMANYTGYSNPEVDDLILKSQQTADLQERGQYLREAQALIAEEVPVFFLGWLATTTALNQRVQGYSPDASGYGEMWNIREWWVQE